jgi:BirA family biotin operon repressor/biotin-[acetyl-CoA-carboxylase] ligase
LHGREVELLQTERRRRGIARGIDARGALRIAFADGEEVVDSGEVSLRMRS